MEEKIILECYQCSTQFKISPSLLGSQGRKVRCTRCKHEWIAKAPREDIQTSPLNPEDTQPILPETSSSLMAESAKKEKLFYSAPLETKSTFLSSVFVTLVMLVGIPSFLYLGRYKIVEFIPHMRPIYHRLGLDVGEDLKALSLGNLTYTQALQNGISTIIVRGQLTNTTNKIVKTPNILISLHGTGDCPTLTWKDKVLAGRFMEDDDGHCTLERWAVQINDGEMLPSQAIPIESSRRIDSKWKIKRVFLDLARR
jgi:predicted Zn finger-like uncharacterized protein